MDGFKNATNPKAKVCKQKFNTKVYYACVCYIDLNVLILMTLVCLVFMYLQIASKCVHLSENLDTNLFVVNTYLYIRCILYLCLYLVVIDERYSIVLVFVQTLVPSLFLQNQHTGEMHKLKDGATPDDQV